MVTLNYSKWDWHGGSYGTIFNREKEDFPDSTMLSTLVEDLHLRGLDDHCGVVVMGEFGRTPKISRKSAAITGRRSTAPCWPGAG